MARQQNRYMIVLICVLGYTLPLVITIGASFRTYLTFRNTDLVRSDVRGAAEEQISMENWRMAKVMMIVIACFVVFWSPIVIYLLTILIEVEHDGEFWPLVGHIGHLVMFGQGIVNPLVYSCKHKAFRQEITNLLHLPRGNAERNIQRSSVLSTTV